MSPVALAYAKAAVNLAMNVNLGAANLYALDAMTVLAGTRDQQEGMKTFFEKRPPSFPGFLEQAVTSRGEPGT
jgi:enoyl-CoA hydratase